MPAAPRSTPPQPAMPPAAKPQALDACTGAPQVLLPVAAPVRSALVRGALLVLAIVSLGVAALGVVLPGLPSTEFVLLSAWAASKSSPRFHAWLLRHRIFGPLLVNWHNGRCISRKAKYAATISMSLCAVAMVLFVSHRLSVIAAITCMIGVQIWIWTRPEPTAA